MKLKVHVLSISAENLEMLALKTYLYYSEIP